MHTRVRFGLALLVCAVLLATPAALLPRALADSPAPNLLVDGDFEAPPVWPMQDGIGEVQVAPGWRAYFLDSPPSYVQVPANCDGGPDGYHCYWMRPEFRDNVSESFPNRVHGGVRSQKYFSFGRMHEAGLYQQVGGITPGSTLRFSIYIQAWQCAIVNNCGVNGIKSDAPAEMHLRVGIDPTGGTNPFAGSVIWAPEQEAFDRWVEFSVTAKAASSTVTVFTHSRPEWDWARMPNDVYLDDATLMVVSGQAALLPAKPVSAPAATATKPAPAPTAIKAALATVQPTPAPAQAQPAVVEAKGSQVVYTVSKGDTAFLIAKRFGITLEALITANHIRNPNIVRLGEQLVIPVGTAGTLPSAPAPASSGSSDASACATNTLLVLHTLWNGQPEPGVRFDFHSQPFNPGNDPSKFRYATDAKGTAYFCMPPHTRLYFFTDRDMGFDDRLESGEVKELTLNVPRLSLTLNGPLGNTYKPEAPVQFSWQAFTGAAYYVVTVYGEQHGAWGGSPTTMVFTERVQAPKTEATTSFSLDAVKGVFAGEPLKWLVTAYNAQGVLIGQSKLASLALIP